MQRIGVVKKKEEFKEILRGGWGTEGRLFRRGRGGVVVYVENVDCIEEGEGMHI